MDAADLRLFVLWLQTSGLRIAVVVLAALAARFILNAALGRFERDQGGADGEERRSRARTVAGVLRSLGLALVAAAAALMILSELGMDTAPLLAGAGILGLALGLGAQTLVRDLIGGLFILAEDQFHVGDNVRIGTATGVVERITLRATYLRDLDGALHLIPNGEIRAVANLSRGWSQAVVDVIIPADRPVAAALAVLESVCEAAAVDPELAPLLDGPPRVAGVEAVEAAGVRLRILARTGPGQQWQAARILRARALPALLGAALEVAAVLPADRPAPPTSDAGER